MIVGINHSGSKDYIGKQLYDDNGIYLGKLKDITKFRNTFTVKYLSPSMNGEPQTYKYKQHTFIFLKVKPASIISRLFRDNKKYIPDDFVDDVQDDPDDNFGVDRDDPDDNFGAAHGANFGAAQGGKKNKQTKRQKHNRRTNKRRKNRTRK